MVAGHSLSLFAVALGTFTLGYALVQQEYVALPGEAWAVRRCFTTWFGAKVAPDRFLDAGVVVLLVVVGVRLLIAGVAG